MNNRIIPYGKQNITESDINEVVSVLKGDYLTQGPAIEQFERGFASYVDSAYGVAVSNGTAALHLLMLALGLKRGQKVITTSLSFAATANSILYCGGEVVFVDIDPDSYLISINEIKRVIQNSKPGEIAGIITVDFAGRVVDQESIWEIVEQYGIWNISDSCHSPGGYFVNSKGDKVKSGSNKYCKASIFSFHPVKHIATGEGGMITTNSRELNDRLRLLRTHGIERDYTKFTNPLNIVSGDNCLGEEYPEWYMEMQFLGYNYRLSDISAALGNSQLKRAAEGVKIRRRIAEFYTSFFTGKDYLKGMSGNIEGHAYHLYVIEVEHRNELYKFLRENGVLAQIHYFPIHKMPYYRNNLISDYELPYLEAYSQRCLTLPIFPELTIDDLNFITSLVDKFYES